MMINWTELVVSACILAVIGLFMWKVWPLIKDNAVAKKAYEIVHQMEELYGARHGEVKFEEATGLLNKWAEKLGLHVDFVHIIETVTAAVGILHAEQGVIPEPFEDEGDEAEEETEQETEEMDISEEEGTENHG